MYHSFCTEISPVRVMRQSWTAGCAAPAGIERQCRIPVAASFAPGRAHRGWREPLGAVVVMPTAPVSAGAPSRVCTAVSESGWSGRAGSGRITAARRAGHRLRGVWSGLLEDEHVAVRVAEDGLGGPGLPLRRAVELDTGSLQPLEFGVEVIAGKHEPAQ